MKQADHTVRAQLATAIRTFLNNGLSPDEFLNVLSDVQISSNHPLIHEISLGLSGFIGDDDDTAHVQSKLSWGYLQRVLLALETDAELEMIQNQRPGWTRIVAIVALITLSSIAFQVGFSLQLIPIAIIAGLLSVILSFLEHRQHQVTAFDGIIEPFNSLDDLRIAYECSTFHKMRQPQQANAPDERFLQMHSVLGVVFTGPILLFFHAFPDRTLDFKLHATTPKNSSG